MAVSRRKALGIFGGGAVLAATAKGATDVPKSQSQELKSVAIIGGGISGLSVAYNLVKGDKLTKFNEIKVFEKTPTLGGNAATAKVQLGVDFRGSGKLSTFERLADLGVNDVNLASYKRLREAMSVIQYPVEENLLPLEDTVAFFTPDISDNAPKKSEIWTKDGYLTGSAQPYKEVPIDDRRGVVDTSHSLHNNPELAEAEEAFMEQAAKDYAPPKVEDLPDWWNYSVAEYLDSKGISEDEPFVRLLLYPRISAMYFADQRGPAIMPMRGVMSYYRLQEGIGNEPKTEFSIDMGSIDRRYFAKGSQHWIDALASWLEKKGVKIYREFEAVVSDNGKNGVKVENVLGDNSKSFDVDCVVMAGHADHQLQSLEGSELLSSGMREILKSVEHSNSEAYAHTWNRLLPPKQGTWRTYNVMIRESGSPLGSGVPYQMTYVQNRHRNDRHHEEYNQYGLPEYFVSLNPEMKIPEEYILKRTEEDTADASKKQAGYNHNPEGDKEKAKLATATFRHVVMTKELLHVQQTLPKCQGMAGGRVFFAGCWTNGAGLHEECFEQAELVVKDMIEGKVGECIIKPTAPD